MLTNPRLRTELIEYLREASSAELHWDSDALNFLVHFIFDDNDFPDSRSLVGDVFETFAEGIAVEAFVSALSKAIGPGPAWRPAATVDWSPVQQAALTARAALGDS